MADPVNQSTSKSADLDDVTDEAIAFCDGDLRATVGALVTDNLALERELRFASLAMSYGFSRGWFARQRERRIANKPITAMTDSCNS